MSKLAGVYVCGGGVALAFGGLAWLSRTTVHLNVWAFLALMAVAWSAALAGFVLARPLAAPSLFLPLWIWAVVLRATGLAGDPILEDDYFRYLWDGRQFALTGNPYATAPAEHFADETVPDRFQAILNNINHPHLPTIYGPVCEYVFLLGHWIAPGRLWPIKLLLIVADLLALAMLLRLTGPRAALLYAWCPLLVQEVAFTAHPEILGVVFIVAALDATQRGRAMTGALLCGFAVAARIHAVLIVPFVFCLAAAAKIGRNRDGSNRGTVWLRCFIAFAFGLALLYLPFWLRDSTGDLTALRAFLSEWEFNSSVFGLLRTVFSFQTAKWICAAAFGAVYVVLLLRCCPSRAVPRLPDAVPGDLIYGAFLLCSAVVNPWYALWLAPFVALRPSLTGVVAMMAVTLSYLHGANLGWPGLATYEHPQWLRPLEYGLILAAASYQWRRNLLAAKRNAH